MLACGNKEYEVRLLFYIFGYGSFNKSFFKLFKYDTLLYININMIFFSSSSPCLLLLLSS